MAEWPPPRSSRPSPRAFVYPRPSFPRLPPRTSTPTPPRYRNPGGFPGRYPPPSRPRFRPPPPIRNPPPFPSPRFPREQISYPPDDFYDHPPPIRPRLDLPNRPDRPRRPPPPPSYNGNSNIPSLLSMPEPPKPPIRPAEPVGRPRRTLFQTPPPSSSQTNKSEFVIIDYGHNSSKSDLSKTADLLCFDYDHQSQPKPIGQDSHASTSEDDQMETIANDEVEEDDYRWGEEFFYRLALDTMNQYDKSYEQSIWDYDPKFTWDYLPGTSRGADEIKEFVVGKNYYEEETKWRRHKRTTDQVYSHEIAERKAKLEKGESLYNEEEDKPISVRPADLLHAADEVFLRFEREIGFPEESIKDDYCSICGISFESVLSSMKHYNEPEHENKVRQHFVSGLLKLGAISKRDTTIPKFLETGVIKRAFNKYKTRPESWTCELCDVVMNSLAMAELHLNGASHLKRKLTIKNMFSV